MGREAQTDQEGELHREAGEAETKRPAYFPLRLTGAAGMCVCTACEIVYYPGADNGCPDCGALRPSLGSLRFRPWPDRPSQPRHHDAPQGPGDRTDES